MDFFSTLSLVLCLGNGAIIYFNHSKKGWYPFPLFITWVAFIACGVRFLAQFIENLF